MDMLVSGPSIVKVLFAALLLANFRAIWIASHWRPDSEEAAPAPRWSENWSDKFADQLPMWLWPKIRLAHYFLFSSFFLLLPLPPPPLLLHPPRSRPPLLASLPNGPVCSRSH